jgi:hypothetical protein
MSLTFITFIFKIRDKTFYGKYYTDIIAPDHAGLDEEIKPYLLKGISEYQKLHQKPPITDKIQIGILSVSTHNTLSIHSTNAERNCFDFYCEKFTINHTLCLEMYMFGKCISLGN